MDGLCPAPSTHQNLVRGKPLFWGPWACLTTFSASPRRPRTLRVVARVRRPSTAPAAARTRVVLDGRVDGCGRRRGVSSTAAVGGTLAAKLARAPIGRQILEHADGALPFLAFVGHGIRRRPRRRLPRGLAVLLFPGARGAGGGLPCASERCRHSRRLVASLWIVFAGAPAASLPAAAVDYLAPVRH